MDEVVPVDHVVSRFEKVLRFYWDGIAVPPFVAGKADPPRRTFLFRLLGYSPDYYGEVRTVSLETTRAASSTFAPLCNREDVTTSMSSRIGAHYSPMVGLFRFREAKSKTSDAAIDVLHEHIAQVRIPAVPCEDQTSVYTDSTPEYRELVRMQGLTELYEPLVKEYSRMSQESLRRVVVLATQGLDESSKQWVIREMSVITDEYTKWLCEAIFFYMCVDPIFRTIVAPLQVMTRPVNRPFKIIALSGEEREVSHQHFMEAKLRLQESLPWNKATRGFFEAMRVCWEKNFKRLALFDLSIESPIKGSGAFLDQLGASMRAALAKIRIEFYSNLEDFFFTYVVGAREILVMETGQIQKSRFRQIFLAARMFEINQLRELVFDNLQRLVDFFDFGGRHGRRMTPKIAQRHKLLELELVIGDKYEPRSPAFSHFRFGMLDLFEELLREINNFPLPECAVLRTLAFDNAPLVVVDAVEMALFRSPIMEVLEEVSAFIDEVSHRYSFFAELPTINSVVARSCIFRDVQEYALELRDRLCEVESVSPNVVYAGRFAITCTSVKDQYRANWRKCLERFYQEYHNSVTEILEAANEKCLAALSAIQQVPKTVKQLEEYLDAVKVAEALAEKLEKTECELVLTKFNWMEVIQIPVDMCLYEAALGLMRWPARLREVAEKVDTVRDQSRPILLAELNRLRTETRANIRTLATGVTELYSMFNLEICDIAAQTCSELRELVDHIEATVDTIRNQELALGLSTVDRFEDLPSLLNYFEIIEQYWTAIYKATGLREFYTAPVSSLNAVKAIEDVREWRRLIHTSTRSLRAFVPLVRLGQQQELALSKFEALEDLLNLLASPGLRKSHWKEIARLVSTKLGEDVAQVGDMTISLQKLLDAGIVEFIHDLERVASQARSDFEVESKLEEMKSTAKRTYFQVVTVGHTFSQRSVLSQECRHNVNTFVEHFIHTSRVLRRSSGLSPLVMKAVSEWENASERTRDTFLQWENIDKQWSSLFSFYLALDKRERAMNRRRSSGTAGTTADREPTGSPGPAGKDINGIVLEKLQRAWKSFHIIYTTVSKPQFSLYTAVVQESLAENLSVAKVAMDEATNALTETFERMRATFPRFNFVTDAELVLFMTAHNTENLVKMLPSMYARLSSVTIEKNAIVMFSTADGGSIPVSPEKRLPITDEPTAEWMKKFDQCLVASLFHAILNCANEYAHVDLDVWIGNWCTQLILMALRITHTKEMRDAIQIGGRAGLRAYKTKVNCVLEEMTRLATVAAVEGEAMDSATRARLGSALVYMHHAAKEVELALANKIASSAELDTTSMLQTFMTDSTIIVRSMGIDFAYGFEFLGDYQLSLMTPHLLEKVISLLAFNGGGGGGGTPILCGGVEKERAVELAAQTLGSFLMRIQCCEMTALPALRPHLRGAVELGVILCVQDCEQMSSAVLHTFMTCFRQVHEGLRQQSARGPVTVTLPLGMEDGAPLSVAVSPRFLAVLTTESLQGVPNSLSLNYRAMHFCRLGSASVVQNYLAAFGLCDTNGICGPMFGALYEQFHEANSVTFSDAALMALLRGAAQEPLGAPPSPEVIMERLLNAFLSVFSPRIREDERLRHLLDWNIEHTLNAFDMSDECRTTLEQLKVPVEKLKSDDLFDRFAEMMTTCTNAVLVGPRFSGKTKLWRRWVGQTKHTVFSPSLMASEDFYGSETRPGLLSFLGKHMMQSPEPHFIVVEDGDLSTNSLWAAWPQFSRVPGRDTCFITSPFTHIVVTTRSLHDTTPRLVSDFGIFYLPQLRDWRRFLKGCVRSTGQSELGKAAATVKLSSSRVFAGLGGSPGGTRGSSATSGSVLNDIAVRVMEALLPSVFNVVYPETPSAALLTKRENSKDSSGAPVELNEEVNNLLFAMCQRCGTLYRRWHQHATEQYARLLGKVSEDYLVDDKAFAAQCAVFAVCWASCLALEETEHYRLSDALRKQERALQNLAETFGIAEPLLPLQVLSDKEDGESSHTRDRAGGDILRLVVTRGGWKTFEEAEAFGIDRSWSTYSHISANSHAWTQRFLLPSRLPTLGAVECLLNCGQSVILCGTQGSGKSTLLQTIPLNDRWTSQLVSTNKSLNPAFVQEEMFTGLSRRSDGSFGPPVGRKLVVCIDDVHLSQHVEPDLPLVGRFISFCDKFAAITTPTQGLVPTTDVVFLGTSLDRKYDAMVQRACVKVRMPDFLGSELVQGVWKLFEAACGRKRVEAFPRACVSFLTLAHAAFVRLLPGTPSHLLCTPPPDPPLAVSGGQRDGVNDGTGSAGTRPDSASPRNSPLVLEAEHLLPWRLGDALRAAEFTRQQLMASTSDVQVATNLFSAVKTLYTTYMSSSGAGDEVTVYKARIGEAAQKTLGTCLRDVSFANILAQERKAEAEAARQRKTYYHYQATPPSTPGGTPPASQPLALGHADSHLGQRADRLQQMGGLTVTEKDRDRVAEWIAEFEMTVDEATEEVLETKFSHKSSAKTPTATRTLTANRETESFENGTGQSAETGGSRSTLLTYAGMVVPQGYSRVATPMNRPGSGLALRSGHGSRRSSSAGLYHASRSGPTGTGSNGSSRRGSLRGGRALGVMPFPVTQVRQVSRTYQTTWLTAVVVRLYRTIHQHDSHVALIGDNTFGTQRLLRLLGSATRVPLAIFRDEREKYTFSVFRTELRSLIMFVYTNDVRANAFFPPSVLRIPGVMRQLDIIMRSGEINELFTVEERAALGRGYRFTHTGAAPLSSAEYVDMRRRVRRNLRFITHLPSHLALQQLANEYPSMARIMAIPLHTPELVAGMLREITMGILTEERVGSPGIDVDTATADSDRFPVRVLNNNEDLAELLSTMFETFCHEHPSTRLEHLMELAREVRRLRETHVGLVLRTTETARVILGRADEATAQITQGTDAAKQATAELSTTRATIEALKTRLLQEDKQLCAWRNGVERAKADVAEEERRIEEEAARIQESLQRAGKAVTTAAARLRRVKSTYVRSLAVLRLPEKGILLVKAIYRVLNEELPKHGNSPSTLWTLALRYICSPEFPDKLASRQPEKEKDPQSLLAMEEELSEVRYANASPYAQLIADFILAYMGNIRTQIRVTEEDQPRLAKQRAELVTSQDVVEDLETKEQEALDTKTTTATLIAEMEANCARLEDNLNNIAEREKHLFRYVGLADRFARFVTKKRVEGLTRDAERAEGNALAVSFFYSTSSLRADGARMYERLRQVMLDKKGIPSSPLTESPSESLCFPGHEALMSQFVSPDLPLKHRMAMYGLIQRVSCRWQFFGGVCPTFERSLREYLSVECTGCLVVSALDLTVKEQIMRAMKDGEGVLLRDADNQVAFDIVRELFPLLEKLHTHRASVRYTPEPVPPTWDSSKATESGGKGNAALAAPSRRGNSGGASPGKAAAGQKRLNSAQAKVITKISFHAFGRDTEVNPKFFLLGTSTGLFSSDEHPSSACECANVMNFFTPLPRETRFRALLLTGGSPKNTAEEIRERRERYYHSMLAFMESHRCASVLLGSDLDSIITTGDSESGLDQIERVLTDVDTYDGQLAHAHAQMQSLLRQQREAWEPLEQSLHTSADLLGFLESQKMGRPWDDRILDSFVANITVLSPVLVARLAPQLFADLPAPVKYFYALVNYLDAVIQTFSCGWPAPVRGVFSLYFFSGVAVTCKEIAAHRGMLYPSDVELLNAAQWKVLHRILSEAPMTVSAHRTHAFSVSETDPTSSDGGDGENEAQYETLQLWLLEQYRGSGDVLLQELAREMDPTDFFILSPYASTTNITGGPGPVATSTTTRTVATRASNAMWTTPASTPGTRASVRGIGAASDGENADHDGTEARPSDPSPSNIGDYADSRRSQFNSSATFIAYFFRSLAELNYDQAEHIALQLCGSFFSTVKDANAVANKETTAVSASLPRSKDVAALSSTTRSAGAGESMRTGSLRVGRIRTSHTDKPTTGNTAGDEATSSRGLSRSQDPRSLSVAQRRGTLEVSGGLEGSHLSGRRDRGSIGAAKATDDARRRGELEQQPVLSSSHPTIRVVHSLTTMTQRAASDGLPICFPAAMPTTAIKKLRQQAATDKWAFQWREADSVRTLEKATQEMLSCFHQRPFNRVGHLVAVYVDIDESAHSPAERRSVVGQVHRMLSTYQGYRSSLSTAVPGSTGGVPVCLVLVCTPHTHNLLWDASGESAEVQRSRCLYDNRDFVTPRDHLLALLESGTVQDRLGTFTTLRKAYRGGDHQSGVAGRVPRFVDNRKGSLTSFEDGSGADFGPNARKGNETTTASSLTPLEIAATLVAKELAVTHVGLAARQLLLVREWEPSVAASAALQITTDKTPSLTTGVMGSPFTLPCLCGSHLNDDDSSLMVLLECLHAWVQRGLRMVDALTTAGVSGVNADPAALAAAGFPPGTIRAADPPTVETGRPPASTLGATTTGSGGCGTAGKEPPTKSLPGVLRVKAAGSVSASASEPAPSAVSHGKVSLGMQAYLLYRNQRPMWRLQNAASEALRESGVDKGEAKSSNQSIRPSKRETPSGFGSVASVQRPLPLLGLQEEGLQDPPTTAPQASGVSFPHNAVPEERQRKALRQLRHVLHIVFQKLTFELYTGGGNSVEERVAVQRAVSILLVPPQSDAAHTSHTEAIGTARGGVTITTSPTQPQLTQMAATAGVHAQRGSVGSTSDLGMNSTTGDVNGAHVTISRAAAAGTVSCNLTGFDPYCPLVLDTNPDFSQFTQDVRDVGSDLTELIGDAEAYRAWSVTLRSQVARFLFATTASTSSGSWSHQRESIDLAMKGGDDKTPRRRPKPLSTVSIKHAASSVTSQFDEDVRSILSDTAGAAEDGEKARDTLAPAQIPVNTNSHSGLGHGKSASEQDAEGLGEWQSPFGQVEDSDEEDTAASHNRLAPHGSTAALIWSFEEAGLRHLYDDVLNFSGAPTESAVDDALRGLVLETARSIASAVWQNPTSLGRVLARRTQVGRGGATLRSSGGLSLWVPALSRPYVTMTLMMRTLHESTTQYLYRGQPGMAVKAVHAGTPSGPLAVGVTAMVGEPALLLVIAERRLLSPGDIIATRARPSPLLMTELRNIAGWSEQEFRASWDANGWVNGPAEASGTDIVVAFRFVVATRRGGKNKSTQNSTPGSAKGFKRVQFYDLSVGNPGATQVVHTTLHVPKPPVASTSVADSGVAFLWRSPERANQIPPPAVPPSEAHVTTCTTDAGAKVSTSHAIPTTALSTLSALDGDGQTPPPNSSAPPTFVTATDETFERNVGSPKTRPTTASNRDTLSPFAKQYALSCVPIPFYARSLHDDDIHADAMPTTTTVPTVAGDALLGDIAETNAVNGRAKRRWREVVQMPVCVLFGRNNPGKRHEKPHNQQQEEAERIMEVPPQVRSDNAVHIHVNALPISFPHSGALGHYIVCD